MRSKKKFGNLLLGRSNHYRHGSYSHMSLSHSVLVLGIGNSLLGDEGAGIAVLKFLEQQQQIDQSVRLLDGGTLSFTLAGELDSASALIVLDAAELNSAPGTVKCFENEAMDRFLGQAKRSAHEVGLLDLMDMARLMDNLPQRRALIGIQHKQIDWSTSPTPAVASAIPEAAEAALKLIQKWTQ